MLPLEFLPLLDALKPSPAATALPWADYDQRVGTPSRHLLGGVPDCLFVSPGKTGSTWLHLVLSGRSDVFVHPAKEVRYFCSLWPDHSVDWYLNHFLQGVGRLKIDISPTYAFLPPEAIARIHSLNPDARLVLVLRDPAERAWSHVRHMWRYREGIFRGRPDTNEPDLELLRTGLLEDSVVLASSYADILRRWTDVFPVEQILVGAWEEINRAPMHWLARLAAFLGLASDQAWDEHLVQLRIMEGVPIEQNDEIRGTLRLLFARRTEDAISYLRDKFGLDVSSEWNRTPAPSQSVYLGSAAGYQVHLRAEGFRAVPWGGGSSHLAPTLGGLLAGMAGQDRPEAEGLRQVIGNVIRPAVLQSIEVNQPKVEETGSAAIEVGRSIGQEA